MGRRLPGSVDSVKARDWEADIRTEHTILFSDILHEDICSQIWEYCSQILCWILLISNKHLCQISKSVSIAHYSQAECRCWLPQGQKSNIYADLWRQNVRNRTFTPPFPTTWPNQVVGRIISEIPLALRLQWGQVGLAAKLNHFRSKLRWKTQDEYSLKFRCFHMWFSKCDKINIAWNSWQ